MSAEPVILLVGRRDHPTDGVADYCDKLREYGAARGLAFEAVPVRWAEKGWNGAFAELREAASAWRDRWVLLQYTTLGWSHRGFPLRAPRVLEVLRQCSARPGVVLHDFAPQTGSGIVAGIREMCQLRVLRQLYERSDLAIFTIPVKNISWLPMRREKAVFIPVGANCPELPAPARLAQHEKMTVAIYGITGGSQMLPEVADIAFVVKQAVASGRALRLIIFGRGSGEAEPALRSALAGVDVEIDALGLISPEEVPRALARADALLFVRGHISSRRGSAIAGIAGGLPVVCYAGPDTDWPVTEAGIMAAPMGDRQALAAALENVLSDASLRKTLSERSRQAHEKYFSWAAITARFAAEIGQGARCVSAA
ncbi:MAG: glycosyltransferase [Acidobacteriia bacterium]|nr:glycosyltransferase [Terriglobia bacterium]